jgi:hypothetical protein
MTLNKIRDLIAARQEKITQMEKNFEDHRRIARYKQDSLEVIKQDYKKQISELQAKNKAAQEAIAAAYHAKRPSVRDQAEHLMVLRTQYRAATPLQLEKYQETLMTVPPGSFEVEDYHALASELRDRGMIDRADTLASYTEVQHIATPYIHNEEFRALERTGERLKVYAAQSDDLLILSPDPNEIGKDDVVTLSHIDDGEGKVPS